jgi:hypothetical protein
VTFRNKLVFFYSQELLALLTNPHAEGPLIAGRPRLFIQHIRSYPTHLQAVSSTYDPRTCHVMVTGTHIIWPLQFTFQKY